VEVSNLVYLRDYLFAPGRCVGVYRVDHVGAVQIDSDSSAFRWISEDELSKYVFMKPQQQVLQNLFQDLVHTTAANVGRGPAGDPPPTVRRGMLLETPGRPWGSTKGSLAYLPLD